MATIKEIAKQAGVSIGTVDRVLHDRGTVNPDTKARVLQVIKDLHYKPNHVAQGLAVRKKNLKLCFLIPDMERHPFFRDVYLAAKEKAKELAYYGVEVIFLKLPFDPVQAEEKARAMDMSSLDGLVTVGMRTSAVMLCVDKAAEAGLPVVLYNGLIEGVDHLACVGCDYRCAGRLAAGLCALAGGEDSRVCIYSEGAVGVDSHDGRLQGFREECAARYPRMKVLDVRQIEKDPIDNYLSAKEMLTRHPDVNMVYIINPGDYSICKAISRADEDHRIKIITNDLVDEQKEMIQQGIISATVCQEPDKQGALSLDILFRYLAYGVVPKQKMYFTNLSIHIAQNT